MRSVVQNKFTCPGNNQTWVVGVVGGLCPMQSFRNLGKLIWFLGSSLKKGRHLPNRQRKGWKRVKAHLVLNHLDPEGPGITYVCIFFMRITHMAILGYQGNLKVQSLTGQPFSNFNSYPEIRVQIVDRHLTIFVIVPYLNESENCSVVSTLCDPIGYTVHGILQARIPQWVAFPFSRGSSQPRDRTQVSCIASVFFTHWATKEAHWINLCNPFDKK